MSRDVRALESPPREREYLPVRGVTLARAAALTGRTRRQFMIDVRQRRLPQPLNFGEGDRWDAVRLIGQPDYVETATRYGTVYLVGFGPYVKIGFTAGGMANRIAALQTGCPEKLETFAELDGSTTMERELHARFGDRHIHGDWFRREGALAEWIEAGCPL